jgi:hypothetical protein
VSKNAKKYENVSKSFKNAPIPAQKYQKTLDFLQKTLYINHQTIRFVYRIYYVGCAFQAASKDRIGTMDTPYRRTHPEAIPQDFGKTKPMGWPAAGKS